MKNFIKTTILLISFSVFIVSVIFLTSRFHGIFLSQYKDNLFDFIVTYGGMALSVFLTALVLSLIGIAFNKVKAWKKMLGE